jgi:gliding motility-associated-like protein
VEGCTATDIVTVTVNPLPIVNAGVDQTVCAGTAVTLTATGASTYSWDNGITNGVAFTPIVGAITYTVTGTSAAGCIGTDQVLVTVNPNPSPIINGPTDYCIGNPALLSTSVPFTTYNWSTAVSTATTSATIANNPITVTVTNAFGCTGTSPAYIVNENLIITSNSTQTICQGQSVLIHGVSQSVAGLYSQTFTTAGCDSVSNVTLVVNPLPAVNAGIDQTVCTPTATTLTGSGAATYAWNNGITNGVPFTQAVGTTTYTVTGTDANGCINTDQVNVTVNPLPIVNAGPDQSLCIGASATIAGSGAATYTWNNGVTNNVAFTPALTNTYTVTGTDANGCVSTDQVVVTVNPLPTVGAGPDQAICIGASVTLSGTGATSYTWNNAVTNGIAFSPVATATYTVTGTDANGCINTDQVVVTVNPLPTINAGIDQTVCTPTATTLTGSGGATYTWNNGITNGVSFTQAVGTTTYTITGTDANGCINTDQVNITVNPLPIVNAGPDQAICIGASATIAGSGAATYTWNNGVTNNVAFTPALTNTYTVTGTDANGCVNTDQVVVTVNPLPTVGAGADQTICIGASVTLSGTGATSYTWNNAVTNGIAFSPVATATYTVTGTDANGCINTDQVVVTVNPLPIVNAGPDQDVCQGTVVTLSGGGASTYSWDNGVINGTPFTQAVGTVTYTVTGTDANGCINTDQADITVNPTPVVNAGLDQTICVGTALTLTGSGTATYSWNNGVTNNVAFAPSVGTVTYTVTGTSVEGCVTTDDVTVIVNPLPVVFAGNNVTVCEGTTVTLTGSGASTYTWSPVVSNGIAFVPTLGTTTYTVTGTSAAGCINTDQLDVIVNPIPVVSFTPDVTIGCAPLTVNLTNTTPNSVDCLWTISNGTVLTGCGTVPVTFTQGGCYDVTLSTTSNNGCVGTLTTNNLICVEEAPIASFAPSSNTVTTNNTEVIFTNESIGATSYYWTFGDATQPSTDINPTHVYPDVESGNYLVTLVAYSPLGCSDTALAYINVVEELIFYVPNTFTPDDDNYNPVFQPVFTSGFDPYDFTLLIFNRWGELIFESHDASIGWNGSYGSNGEIEMCQDGTYTWKIEFKTKLNDERKMVVGHVNLLR